ncbi:hypothetical protein [Flavobacterium sp. NRK1]|uniref:hypothetical protein n=1 Tax=Flavobacterium sp. NRK1 TaxID=2954929 RepID=UPI0020923A28|nr:hypothetical protein [Flavobacterium sp. NRK1]MCO6146564.1 hypothetical protein [Flavobacterium sp. NRK1]
MKKITRPLFAASIIAIVCILNTGCSKKESQKENQELQHAERLLSETEREAYMNQMPLVASTEKDRKKDMSKEPKFFGYQNVSKFGWHHFDKLYNDSLSNPTKQDIGYIILCKKDLIGQVNKQPDNAELVAALKKYVDVLTRTEYMGYTSLYYALQTLKPIDEAYVKEKSAVILKYAKKDTFHPMMINDKENMNTDKKTYNKCVENFKYISRIATL